MNTFEGVVILIATIISSIGIVIRDGYTVMAGFLILMLLIVSCLMEIVEVKNGKNEKRPKRLRPRG